MGGSDSSLESVFLPLAVLLFVFHRLTLERRFVGPGIRRAFAALRSLGRLHSAHRSALDERLGGPWREACHGIDRDQDGISQAAHLSGDEGIPPAVGTIVGQEITVLIVETEREP